MEKRHRLTCRLSAHRHSRQGAEMQITPTLRPVRITSRAPPSYTLRMNSRKLPLSSRYTTPLMHLRTLMPAIHRPTRTHTS